MTLKFAVCVVQVELSMGVVQVYRGRMLKFMCNYQVIPDREDNSEWNLLFY